MRIHRILLPLAAVLLAACTRASGTEQQQQTFYVAPYLRACTGEFEQMCMLVKQDPAADWQLLYDDIRGFTYEPGYDYVLIVGWREIPNPPQDSGSREYWLIRQVSKTPAATP